MSQKKVTITESTVRLIYSVSFILLALIMCNVYTSCRSVHGFSGTNQLYGIVTYTTGESAVGRIVSVDGKECAACNVNGLFVIPAIKAGHHVFTVCRVDENGEEITDFSRSVTIEDRTQMVSFIIPKVVTE